MNRSRDTLPGSRKRRYPGPSSPPRKYNIPFPSIGWFDLPFEMRLMVINQMDRKTLASFSQCSKICSEESKKSSNYLYGIELQGFLSAPRMILSFEETSRCDISIHFSINYGRTAVYFCSIVGQWKKIERGLRRDIGSRYFIEYLEKYKNSIRSLCIDDRKISLNDFTIRSLKRLEILEIRNMSKTSVNILENGFMDFQQFKKIKRLDMPNMKLTFDQIVAFQGKVICVSSKDFDTERINKYLKLLKNEEIYGNLQRVYIYRKAATDIDIDLIMNALDVFDFTDLGSSFLSRTRKTGKYCVRLVQNRELGIKWEENARTQDPHEEIKLEKNITERCKRSIERNEPYDLASMKQQIEISQSKIATMKMKLVNLQNVNEQSMRRNGQCELSQKILNTQLLCDGADKVKQSLAADKNSKRWKDVEQTILELNEKLELLLRCARKLSVESRRTLGDRDDSHVRKSLVQVSGVLKIRVTGLYHLNSTAPPKTGKYASEHLKNSIEKKKSVFERYGGRRTREQANDYIVVMHVGGKTVATVVWNEKKTMYGGDEVLIELRKCRQIELEVYHTDSRSLCAIGTFYLNELLEEEVGGFGHRSVKMLPGGTLHFQTEYNDPEHIMKNKLMQEDWKNSISFRNRSGSVLARCSRSTYTSRPSIRSTQFSQSETRRSIDCLAHYNFLDLIGVGAFGTVRLAQRIDNRKMYYAVKRISQSKRTRSFETPELQILKELSHPFICNLITSFIENKALYIVLEFCEAGDLHTHLSRTYNGFAENQVIYFAASIVLAVEYLHERLYVHRDLKTENIMLTRKGHLKIIDFGLCRKLKYRREKMSEIVGTTTHLAAEVHRREPYGIEIDWWAVGVSLYQLRTRQQPFYGDRDDDMSKNPRIAQWPIFHDLLIQLLARYPEARLGYYSSQNVKDHPFFMDTNFENIYNMTTVPPYIPFLKSGIDLEYFNQNELCSSECCSSSSCASCCTMIDHNASSIHV